jgi:uncharacterized protein (UPF0335 family)
MADALNNTAQTQIRSVVERVERLAKDQAEIAEQIKEVYAAAKGNGFDVKILKRVVRKRKQDAAKRQEEEAIEDLYWSALGELPLFETIADREASANDGPRVTVTFQASDGSSVTAPLETVGAAMRVLDASDDALYAQAVQVVRAEGKASTSYVQRRLQLGYNKAAALMERMEREGVVGPPNHAGKREIIAQAAA